MSDRFQSVVSRARSVRTRFARLMTPSGGHDDDREFRTRLLDAQEAVRSQIARELHDDLSQRLAALAIRAHLMEHAVREGTRLEQADLVELCSALDHITADVQGIARELHPTIVHELGLAAALRSECHRRHGEGEVRVHLEFDLASGDPAAAQALALFRIAQEAMTNASKHSGANCIVVELSEQHGMIALSVRDNGRGMQAANSGSRGTLGMTSMLERAQLAGGTLVVDSKVDVGTAVIARIPRQPLDR